MKAPEVVGRYRIERKLGQGGMGSVWAGEDTFLGREVAIKLLPEEHAQSAEARERFLREARAACSLSHPGIATVFDAGEDGDRVFIAFELIQGETVSDRLRSGPLPWEDAVRVAREVAGALAHAHDGGILHRDVTSGNVMVDREGRAKVVDFGLARPESDPRITQTGSALGTVGYTAPEVARGEAADRRSDLYGLGVVLYEMLTGRLPFEGARPEAVLYSLVHEEPELPTRLRKGLPEAVDHVVRKALAKRPEERYQTAEALRDDLARIEMSERAKASRRSVRKKRQWQVLAALVAVTGSALWVREILDRPTLYDSVAVLPLQNTSENPEASAYLASGVADALAIKLTKISHLRVTPWITSQRYAPSVAPLQDIAEELNVDVLVVGTFRATANDLLFSLAIVEGSTGKHMWTEDFRATADELLELPEAITAAVGRKLRGDLSDVETRALARKPTTIAKAYDLYLRGSAAMWGWSRQSTGEALALFDQALDLDPRLAEAHVGRGAALMQRYFFGWAGDEALTAGEAAFRRAIELRPDHIGARRGLLRVYWERGRSEDSLKLGREIRDSGQVTIEALLARAEAYVYGGLPDRAIPLLNTVTRLDPANQASRYGLVQAGCWASDYENALEACEEYFRRFGESVDIHVFLGWIYQAKGDMKNACRHYDRFRDKWDDEVGSFPFLAVAYQKLGRPAEADSILDHGIANLEKKLDMFPSHQGLQVRLAIHYAMAGDMERAKAVSAIRNQFRGGYLSGAALVLALDNHHADAAASLMQAMRLGWFNGNEIGLVRDLHGLDLAARPEYAEYLEAQAREEAQLRALYAD